MAVAYLSFIQEHKTVQNLPDNVKAQAVEAARPAADIMRGKAAEAARPESQAAPPTQADGKEALIRNQGDQGKTQAALSPTDHGKSHVPSQAHHHDRGRGMER